MNTLASSSVATQDYLTPIEVELQIDENGTTTARALYGFLEMDKSKFFKMGGKKY